MAKLILWLWQEVSIHVYEKLRGERVGRGKRKEAIAELLSAGVSRLASLSSPWLLSVLYGVRPAGSAHRLRSCTTKLAE